MMTAKCSPTFRGEIVEHKKVGLFGFKESILCDQKLSHPDRSEAEWRDLFCCLGDKSRSLGYAARWAASLGMTE